MDNFFTKKYVESTERNFIDGKLYEEHNVKRGLRNVNGTGVLVGLTKICEVHGYNIVDGKKVDDEGHLYYRGYDLNDLVNQNYERYGFERICYLILFGELPTDSELEEFKKTLANLYNLPRKFNTRVILEYPSKNLMNQLQRNVLTLYIYDEDPDSTDPKVVLEKGVSLLAKMPALAVYTYYSKSHLIDENSLIVHLPNKNYSIAENILHLLRKEDTFTKEEAQTLDLLLMIHADHGGANNSTFTNIVVSSTATDFYSSVSAALGSLKGPLHGGASKEVDDMFKAVIKKIGINATDNTITKIVNDLLDKNFYDKKGLIYGLGHAVYTKSDPRAELLRTKCKELAISKGEGKRFDFYYRFEKIAIRELKKRKGENFNVCANVDFYSGLTYRLLDIPEELCTPIFATARMVGWVAHNIENKLYCSRMIRPAALYVGEFRKIGEKK